MSVARELIALDPVQMTEGVMDSLEKEGLIIRLAPDRHRLETAPGQTRGESLYECDPRYGPHKLITVTVNRTSLEAFGTHPDNEDFLLLGDPSSGPLYLVISLLTPRGIAEKIENGTLDRSDFVTLIVRFNDPQVSFFTMLKDVPHGEALGKGARRPSTFYVGESRDLPIDMTDFGPFKLAISEGAR
jgi:hypothetical protein